MPLNAFRFNEEYLSQIPALQQLIKLGYTYLSPETALRERHGKTSNVLLENILRESLKRINRIQYKGGIYLFSEENIQSAVQKLKNVKYDGLLKTNESIYDLLTLGTALEQSIEGDSKSFTLQYIDWKNPQNNTFHVTAEYSVERNRSTETARPDIVLCVNGIPFCVIECKSPKVEVDQGISQIVRNQNDDFIPKLFTTVQMVLSVNKNSAQYGTVATPKKFWAVWKEQNISDATVSDVVNSPLSDEEKAELFTGDFAKARNYFDKLESSGLREVTEQDRTISAMCSPKRLLDLTYRFTLFDGGIKKIARYQQYFVIESTLKRVKQFHDGKRDGGVIWHTQGSGKSLTMVMLARSLAMDPEITNPRIILITDRDDLDKQLSNTFVACGLDANRATSGRNLLELVAEKQAGIVTTLIHKFDKALNVKKVQDDSPDIFMLIDESHRSNFGSFAARMRQMFPNACYLGFTGTPLLKKEKNNFNKFGALIEPHYSITQAVEDGAVVPLLYEGRHVEMEQNKAAIDLWFERHTEGLTKEQKADLKRKYARAEMLNKTDQVIYMRAFDISEHYRANWQGSKFKAQLVAPGKPSALKYHAFLNELGIVTSEVIISGPDMREGYEEVDDEPKDEVVKFWQKMMKRYGSEEEYTKQIINQFKNGESPEILIVVDKLLTGFDAPNNAVLYVCRTLREHTLLQAIARVNRLADGKDFGYIVDYVSVLGELDQALNMYKEAELDGFDAEDLAGTLNSINNEIVKLPQQHSNLLDLFKEVKNSQDEEAYEQLLGDISKRDAFYERLNEFAKTLAIALSSEKFIMETPEHRIRMYKDDLRRFENLKRSVKLRYAEAIDYRDYEPRIKKLLDTQIQANEVIRLNEPVNIFDEQMFNEMKEGRGIHSDKTTAAKADMIAHATIKTAHEKMEEDPAFYEKFSKLIQEAIDAFRAKRLSDLEYLSKVMELRDAVATKKHDDVPTILGENDNATAYFGVIKSFITDDAVAASTALWIDETIKQHYKVQFWDDTNAVNRAINAIDDYLFDEVKGSNGIDLSPEQMDTIIEKTMQVAKHRMP